MSASVILIRKYGNNQSSIAFTFYGFLSATIINGLLCSQNHNPLIQFDIYIFILCGVLIGIAGLFISVSARILESSVFAPIQYSQLLAGLILGYLFFRDLPDLFEIIGSIIIILSGIFIIYTATREILHMMNLEDMDQDSREPQSVKIIITWIVAMNLIFSFDSILSAMALSDVFWIMALAIMISGVLMIWLADRVSEFLQKNRMYEVLGLFILFVVGIMLLSEGGHLAHLHLFNHQITPMSKATFYFVIGILILTDIVQTRYQKKLLKKIKK